MSIYSSNSKKEAYTPAQWQPTTQNAGTQPHGQWPQTPTWQKLQTLAHGSTKASQQQAVQRLATEGLPPQPPVNGSQAQPIQRKIGFEYEVNEIRTRHTDSWAINPSKTWAAHPKGYSIVPRIGYALTADTTAGGSDLEFVTDTFDETNPEEVDDLLEAIDDIIDDTEAIQAVSTANTRGYLAGVPYTRAGEEGYFAGDGWVGANNIFNGASWRDQFRFEGVAHRDLVGQLQMTAGFNINALQQLVSGEALGTPNRNWGADERQFLNAYRLRDEETDTYQLAIEAINHYKLCHNARRATKIWASVLTTMATLSINGRGGQASGNMVAKTDYSAILLQATKATRIDVDKRGFLRALIRVINAHAFDEGNHVNADSAVVLGYNNLSLKTWIDDVWPKRFSNRRLERGTDKMTPANYPGTQAERAEARPYGTYGPKMDPGEKVIYELRQFNPYQTLPEMRGLVAYLADFMRQINE